MRRCNTLRILNANFENTLQFERIYCECPSLPGIATWLPDLPQKKLSVRGNAPGALERHDDKDWARFDRIAQDLRSLGELYS